MKKIIILLIFPFLSACTQALTLYYPDGATVKTLDVATLTGQIPNFDEKGIVIQDLGRTATTSSHLVWIKDREEMHTHDEQDLTVLLLKGKGIFTLYGQNLEIKPGMLVTIPRKAPHAFVNQSHSPAAAYVVFTPPLQGEAK